MEIINEKVMNRISEANIGVQNYICDYLSKKYSQKARERTQLANAKEQEKFDKYNSRSDFNEALLKKMQSLVPPTRSSLLSQDDKFFASYSAVELGKEPINNLEIFKTRLAREWKLKEDVLNATIKKLEETLNGTLSGDALANAAKNEYKNSLDELIKGYKRTITDLQTQNAKYSEDNEKNAETIIMLNEQIKNLDERIDVLINQHDKLKTNNSQKDKLIKQNQIEMQELKTMINNEMQKNYNLQEANAILQTANIKNASAKQEFDNLKSTIETQQRHIKENDSIIARLKAEHDTLKIEFAKNEDELKILTDSLAASTKELSERPDSSDAMQELEKQIIDLQRQISNANRSSSELQNKLDSEIIISVGLSNRLKETYEQATNKILQAKQDNKDLQTHIQTQAKTIEEAKKKEKEINKMFENNKCYIDNSIMYLDWKDWNDVKKCLEQKSIDLKQPIDMENVNNLETLINNLEKKTGIANVCLIHLISISLKFLKSQEKIQYTGDLEEQVEELQKEIKTLNEEIEALKSGREIFMLTNKLSTLKEKHEKILRANQEKVLKENEKLEQSNELETLNKSITDALDNLKLKNEELEKKHQTEIEQARIKYELALTKAELAASQDKENFMNKLTDQNVELSKQLTTLKSELTIKDGYIAKLEGDIENINLKNKIANEANLEIIKTLRENLQTLRDKLKACNNEVDTCKKEIDKYKSQKPIVAPQPDIIDRNNFDLRNRIDLNLSGGAPGKLDMKGGVRTPQIISFDKNEEILVIFNNTGKHLFFQYPQPNNDDDYVTYCTEGDVKAYNAKLLELNKKLTELQSKSQLKADYSKIFINAQLRDLTRTLILSMTASAKLNKDHLSEKIANMANQSIVSLFKNANDDLKNANESLKQEKDDLANEKDVLAQANTALTADKAALEGEKKNLEGEKTKLEDENKKITTQIKDLTKENETLKATSNKSKIATGATTALANAKASLQKFMSKDNRVMFEETKSFP